MQIPTITAAHLCTLISSSQRTLRMAEFYPLIRNVKRMTYKRLQEILIYNGDTTV